MILAPCRVCTNEVKQSDLSSPSSVLYAPLHEHGIWVYMFMLFPVQERRYVSASYSNQHNRDATQVVIRMVMGDNEHTNNIMDPSALIGMLV